MDTRVKRIVIISSIIFTVSIIGVLIFYFLAVRNSSPLDAEGMVIIDNSSDYSEHISSDSFEKLGSYLYEFIKEPTQEEYHATIISGSYSYAPDSWFSKFIVEAKGKDISWNVLIQTLNDGSVGGDIVITCKSGSACSDVSQKEDSTKTLQNFLPINTNDYIISQKLDDPYTLSVVYYDQTDVGKKKALEKIKSLGFDPEDYNIHYYYGGH